MSDKYVNLSRYLSLILRHKPETIGLTLDSKGYLNTHEMIKGINDSGRYIDIEILHKIVNEDSKNRYSFSSNYKKIRASQGHSIKVNLGLSEANPGGSLFHGTVEKFSGSIDNKGLLRGDREYVHLSSNIDEAIEVGKRRGTPLIYEIDAKRMLEDGVALYLSENDVWLARHIPVKYLLKREDLHLC